ncbi:glycerol kinase [Agrobacterium tumefaciens]|uniref:FGGY family carbohydrate kinase n=1 Tax=Agrobacterium sp. YIC 4121 TaxID=1923829 RepID=UPI00098F0B1B|nr:FGGY family carbohydrate kinase [Agrobacterium sp. YIC 4121]NTE83985.1 glycerol kinase [Agrobacterium tumefaciens]OOO30979.1 glycerol kinase [Agrobacterium sp. YIC 4121]
MRIAAIDQGTTSTRCLVVSDGGTAEVVASRRHAQFYPAAGHVEHDPEELLGNIRAVLAAAGPVDAIAIANQGESCLAWDAVSGEALSPVIVWQDARTAEALSALPPSATDRSKEICGLPLDPYFSASKLAWLVRHNPAVAQARAAGRLRLGTTDAFFLDRLTGCFRTDLATASRTGLLDLSTGDWSPELCALHGVPLDCLPTIGPVDGGFGAVDGTPIRVSIVDQQAALYGHGCRKAGDCKITFGTGAFLLAVAGHGRPLTGELLPTVGWQMQGAPAVFAIEGGIYDAGAALEWAKKIGLYAENAELDGFEGPSAIRRGLVFVPALSGLAAPYWDRQAVPLFIGMDHATERRDMVRAVLEGIALLTARLIEAASAVAPIGDTISIDGGLSNSRYFARFLAAASGRTICVPAMRELTALGLAELCGVDVAALRGDAEIFAPDGSVDAKDHARFARAIDSARSWQRSKTCTSSVLSTTPAAGI